MSKKKHEEHENHERWLVSYADFITLLFAFFVVMYSISSVNEGRFRAVSDSIQAALKPVVSSPASTKLIPIGEKNASLVAVLSKKAQLVRKLQDVLGTKTKQLNLIEHVNVVETETGMKVAISDSMMFESGQAELKAQAFPILEALAEVLNDRIMKDVKVLGHTDNVPMRTAQFPSNWELSSARAVTVVRALSELYRVPADKMSASGHAEYKPVADNLTPENRAKNRRVELIVLMEHQESHSVIFDNSLGDTRPMP